MASLDDVVNMLKNIQNELTSMNGKLSGRLDALEGKALGSSFEMEKKRRQVVQAGLMVEAEQAQKIVSHQRATRDFFEKGSEWYMLNTPLVEVAEKKLEIASQRVARARSVIDQDGPEYDRAASWTPDDARYATTHVLEQGEGSKPQGGTHAGYEVPSQRVRKDPTQDEQRYDGHQPQRLETRTSYIKGRTTLAEEMNMPSLAYPQGGTEQGTRNGLPSSSPDKTSHVQRPRDKGSGGGRASYFSTTSPTTSIVTKLPKVSASRKVLLASAHERYSSDGEAEQNSAATRLVSKPVEHLARRTSAESKSKGHSACITAATTAYVAAIAAGYRDDPSSSESDEGSGTGNDSRYAVPYKEDYPLLYENGRPVVERSVPYEDDYPFLDENGRLVRGYRSETDEGSRSVPYEEDCPPRYDDSDQGYDSCSESDGVATEDDYPILEESSEEDY